MMIEDAADDGHGEMIRGGRRGCEEDGVMLRVKRFEDDDVMVVMRRLKV